MPERKILVVGDSHTMALRAALKKTPHTEADGVSISILRLMNDRKLSIGGDLTLADLLDRVAAAAPEDVLVTALRGNQYNTMGLLQHPVPFDVLLPGDPPVPVDGTALLIPFAMIRAKFFCSLRRGYGKLLQQIADASRCAVYCLAPPAPKEDADHIKSCAETFFRDGGIDDVGVSPASLRLKLWTLQNQVLEEYCTELGMRFFWPPEGSRDKGGFLRRELYANDATHGNAAYGALVLRQIVETLADPARQTEEEPS